MKDGWIILDKDSGVFSKTAAARVSRLFGVRKNGHIGTLDPMASGVLPIAIGDATKMIPFVEKFRDNAKEYIFGVLFGFETDTLDITGAEVARTDVVPDVETVKSKLNQFVGHITQVPPAYSAIHVDGRRAYEMARRGEKIEIPSRAVDVYALELLGVNGNRFEFKMSCAPGTYVRSIARDIAHACGTIATVDMIRRTRASGWTIKNAYTLDFLENLVNNGGDVEEYLASVDSGLGDIPVLNLGKDACDLYKHGGFIKRDDLNGYYRVYSGDIFIGIGIMTDGILKPKRTI